VTTNDAIVMMVKYSSSPLTVWPIAPPTRNAVAIPTWKKTTKGLFVRSFVRSFDRSSRRGVGKKEADPSVSSTVGQHAACVATDIHAVRSQEENARQARGDERGNPTAARRRDGRREGATARRRDGAREGSTARLRRLSTWLKLIAIAVASARSFEPNHAALSAGGVHWKKGCAAPTSTVPTTSDM
jgi:hypothetical protein